MRHENAEVLLRIAMDMQGRAQGLSLAEIASDYSDTPLSRRTAERMRDAVLRLFPGKVDTITEDSGIKRWKLRSPWLRGLSTVEPETLSSLETARTLLKRAHLHDQVKRLDDLRATLLSLMEGENQRRIEDDLELLMVSEGIALRPGPRVHINPDILATIRGGLKQARVVQIQYRYRESKALRTYDLHPYGLVYGHRHYLLAGRSPRGAPRYFSLGRIESAVLLPHASIKPPKFSLEKYLEQSFGIFQEAPIDVHWRFKPEVASDAAEFLFHPTQASEIAADGSLHVRFRAGGRQEMAWHLHTWGDGVEDLSGK